MFSYSKKISLFFSVLCLVTAAQTYAAGMGDPLRPPEFTPGQAGGNESARSEPVWQVNEILFSGGRRIAVVNDTAVAVGDRINGARVVDIKPALVVLEYKNALINARLHVVSVKKHSPIKIN